MPTSAHYEHLQKLAFAAEVYEHLMSLIPLGTAVRYRPEAMQRVLSATQEHTEEAGHRLARAGQYREAVVALETGRVAGIVPPRVACQPRIIAAVGQPLPATLTGR